MRPTTIVTFKVKPKNCYEKITSFFGVVKEESGYLHQYGYSGKQLDGGEDIAIIEKKNGRVITVPIKNLLTKN